MRYMDYLQKCIEACNACYIVCEKCATKSLLEDPGRMAKSILLLRECSALCQATATILSVGADHYQLLCRSCEELCMACNTECGKHADKPYCKECAEACRICADLCRKIMDPDYEPVN